MLLNVKLINFLLLNLKDVFIEKEVCIQDYFFVDGADRQN